jgi:hypothetical protein
MIVIRKEEKKKRKLEIVIFINKRVCVTYLRDKHKKVTFDFHMLKFNQKSYSNDHYPFCHVRMMHYPAFCASLLQFDPVIFFLEKLNEAS